MPDTLLPPENTPPTESGELRVPPVAQEGNLVTSPTIAEAAGPGQGGNKKAERQALTGHAAKALSPVSLTPAQLTWRELRKNKLALLGGLVLIVLYTVALFAPFLSPYDPLDQNPGLGNTVYHPPMKLRWIDRAGHFYLRPFVYQTQRIYTADHETIYLPDADQKTTLQFFVNGSPFKLFGLIPMHTHFMGVEKGSLYLLGTDDYGRDYYSRLLYGSQISLSIGLIAIAITFSLGLLVGGISGFYGGVTDDVIMRLTEVIMSVPDFYLLLALASTLPADWNPVYVYLLIIVILSLIGWAGMARIVRGMVLSVREREYVEAAKALGVPDMRIIRRHILPSTFTFSIVAATMSVPGYILAEAGLSFLGLGIRDPMASWGNMLAAAQNLSSLQSHRWILAPGLMIFITVLAFNFLGDGLRDALDPKSRR